MSFDLFVGIDWSGAKGSQHRGISVFSCERGQLCPKRVAPPKGQKAFARADVIAYLERVCQSATVLAGIDFAFAYPLNEEGVYFPNLPKGAHQPASARQLWQLIDEICCEGPDYYGGAIWDHPHYGPYYNAPSGRRGAKFHSRRRLTEKAASAVKSPSPTFNCVGPAGVGTGSLAGMRLCHHFADQASIWPFFDHQTAALTLVEIFPSYYFKLAGVRPEKGFQATTDGLNQALRYYGCEPVHEGFTAQGPDGDDADALISAAALRDFARDKTIWDVPASAQHEGWIFGVRSDKTHHDL